MIRVVAFFIVNAAMALAGTPQITLENSNFTIHAPLDATEDSTLYNYDRFRATASFNQDNWFFTSIGDIENYLGREMIESNSYIANRKIKSDTSFSTQTNPNNYGDGEYSAKLYRLYGGYADAKNRVSFGLQKISMGVGRIWNPTDLFNPKNPLALEPDEVYGAFSLAYTYALSDLSQITAVAAQRKDHSLKYAARIKGYVEVVDIALNLVQSEDASMVGYELEGELFESGVAFRSEGGWFEDKLLQEVFFQGIIGADYTFENSLSLTGEWLYSSKSFEAQSPLFVSVALPYNLMQSKGYGGLSIGYEFDALLYGAITSITSADDGSFYVAPSLKYSLADDMSLLVGAMLYGGKDQSEFGNLDPTYYINFKVTF
ncbi:MAG: hypothetical protein PHU40_09770 [Sulfurimonas sp.]|nr:hypothetical protein [Sulfurimonas sp.]